MKTRESGMPDEDMWRSFFCPRQVLSSLGLRRNFSSAAEFGCGYGTFTIPAARMIDGTLDTFDIDAEMVASTSFKAKQQGLSNIRVHQRDFIADGTGLRDASVDYVMLFNILHAEEPDKLLVEAFRILGDNGTLGIMHWNYDPETPRGPSMEIRPKPEQCADWAGNAGFTIVQALIDLPPYHYGIVCKKI